MIYLIGGAPRIGKSIIAKELAQKIGAELVATDDLEMPKNDLPELSFSGDPAENILTSDERVSLQVSHSELSEPNIEHIISVAFNEQKNLVLEGIHLLPSAVAKYVQKYSVAAVFIGWRNADAVFNGMALNNSPTDWLKDSAEMVRRQVADFTLAFSEYIVTETEKYGLSYMERSEDFKGDIQKIILMVTKS